MGHTGKAWLQPPYSLHPDRLRQPEPLTNDAPVTQALRDRLLDQVHEDQVFLGATVRLRRPDRLVLSRRRPVSHGTHAVLTLLTAGVWGLIWLIMAIARKEDVVAYEVDAWGHVWLREGGTIG